MNWRSWKATLLKPNSCWRSKGELEQQAQSLSQLRAKYAGRLASKVTAHIHDLAMPEGRFEIEVTAKDT